MPEEIPSFEVSDAIVEAGGGDLLRCFQCGTCTSVCPWKITSSMRTRMMIHLQQLGLEGYEESELWRCVTCRNCVQNCPRGVGIIDVVSSARSIMVELGSLPRSLQSALSSLRANGNPWQGDNSVRSNLSEKIGIPVFSEGFDYIFFPCCTSIYDREGEKSLKAISFLLNKSGIRAGLLPSGGVCCGDVAKRSGAIDIVTELHEKLLTEFDSLNWARPIFVSPHCFVMMKDDFIEQGVMPLHYIQVLSRLIEEGILKVDKKINAKVTYHDPCYLGRWSGIYEEPRKILRAIAGENFVEMERNRENSICCGGGGGGAFMEVRPQERLAVMRVREGIETGAQVIATACPYCMVMLQDGILAGGLEGKIVVKDVAQILVEAVSEDL